MSNTDKNFAFIVDRRDKKSFCAMKECNCQKCEVCLKTLAKNHKGFIIKDVHKGTWHYTCSKRCSDMFVFQAM